MGWACIVLYHHKTFKQQNKWYDVTCLLPLVDSSPLLSGKRTQMKIMCMVLHFSQATLVDWLAVRSRIGRGFQPFIAQAMQSNAFLKRQCDGPPNALHMLNYPSLIIYIIIYSYFIRKQGYRIALLYTSTPNASRWSTSSLLYTHVRVCLRSGVCISA